MRVEIGVPTLFLVYLHGIQSDGRETVTPVTVHEDLACARANLSNDRSSSWCGGAIGLDGNAIGHPYRMLRVCHHWVDAKGYRVCECVSDHTCHIGTVVTCPQSLDAHSPFLYRDREERR